MTMLSFFPSPVSRILMLTETSALGNTGAADLSSKPLCSLKVQDLPELLSEFKASLDHLV